MKRRPLILCFLLGFLFAFLLTPCFAGNTTTSGVTAQTIIDRVVRDMNGVTGYCSNDDLVQWVNDSVKEIVYSTRCLETGMSTFVVTPLSRSYSLSGLASWLDIEKVEYDSGVTWIHSGSGTTRFDPNYVYDLDRVPFIDLRKGNEKETGSPKVFSVWNNSFYVWPMPDSTLAGTSLYVYYVPAPSGVTISTSAIETPSYFDGVIRDYVRAQALYKDQQKDQGDYYLSRYYARVKNYIVNILRRNIFELPAQNTAQ